MSEEQIRSRLRQARKQCFEVPEARLPKAQAKVRRLKRALFRCPEVRARRAWLIARRNERLLTQWANTLL